MSEYSNIKKVSWNNFLWLAQAFLFWNKIKTALPTSTISYKKRNVILQDYSQFPVLKQRRAEVICHLQSHCWKPPPGLTQAYSCVHENPNEIIKAAAVKSYGN